MDVRNKYVDTLGSWKKTRVRVAYFLCKKITKKQFFKLKTINMMGRKTTLFLRLSSTYYVIGRKKHTCKKVTLGSVSDSRWAYATHRRTLFV